ncbi:unnamed protein product [Rangifer tarandus platyrhynchus]|uniref:Secreted protein n=1 Tax=Rangifer tarandus platyrhynchus TaxID=3082113 RepID=A0ABN8YA38_RANTA|nr:unnamed protein product [Rangifer tarandus platyrhynchus]
MISLWCLSAVLQAPWCCSSKSHHCPFFSSARRHPKYISFPISTPSQAKHKPVSCAAIQKAGTPDTHSPPPSQHEASGGTWSRLQSHSSLGRLSGAKPRQFHQRSKSGQSNQSLGLPSESWNFR